MRRTRNKCKYCGQITNNVDICTRCREKLKLVRKLQRMVREYKERYVKK